MQASAASALSTAAGKLQQHETTAAGAGDAGAGGGGGAAAKVASSAHSEQQPQALRAVEDSELQRLCEKLGLAEVRWFASCVTRVWCACFCVCAVSLKTTFQLT